MSNVYNLGVLDETGSPESLAALPSEALCRLQDALEYEKAVLAKRAAVLATALDIRYRDRAEQARHELGKDTGTVRLVDNDYTVVVEAPKQVHWDREKLADALDTFDVEIGKHYAKWSLSVEERKFTAAPPEVQAVLATARTVSVGKTKYRLEPIMEPLEKTDGV